MPKIELHCPGIEPGPPALQAGTRDNLRGQKSLGPLKMSLEMAYKVILPPKKIISRSFLNSRTLIVIISTIRPTIVYCRAPCLPCPSRTSTDSPPLSSRTPPCWTCTEGTVSTTCYQRRPKKILFCFYCISHPKCFTFFFLLRN